MLILVVLMLCFLTYLSDYVTENDARGTLVRVVEANMDEVEYDDGEVETDKDFAYFKNGVFSVVYTLDYRLIDGHIPSGFQTYTPLLEGEVKTVVSGGQKYYIFDRLITFKKHENLWIRGFIPADSNSEILGSVMKSAFILLPFIVVLAALVGYQIAKAAFKPVDRIINAANEINEGSDLSQRVGLERGSDEIYRLAETFDRMFKRLEASFDEEKQFTSDVSHELRTPISVILSQCEFALEHSSAQEEYRESLETIKRQATRMSRLISQLLIFTRLEQGVEKAIFEDTDLSELVEMVCNEQTEINAGNISMITDIESGIQAIVDRFLFIRMLSNLISNAYEYGREGGEVRVRLYREKEIIFLSVADNGIGIHPDQIDKIWSRFYQVDPSRAANDSGSMGLGLSMVRQIAKIHGGYVKVESNIDKGSTFTFSFSCASLKL
jgi:signal transduction histidine kinase